MMCILAFCAKVVWLTVLEGPQREVAEDKGECDCDRTEAVRVRGHVRVEHDEVAEHAADSCRCNTKKALLEGGIYLQMAQQAARMSAEPC